MRVVAALTEMPDERTIRGGPLFKHVLEQLALTNRHAPSLGGSSFFLDTTNSEITAGSQTMSAIAVQFIASEIPSARQSNKPQKKPRRQDQNPTHDMRNLSCVRGNSD